MTAKTGPRPHAAAPWTADDFTRLTFVGIFGLSLWGFGTFAAADKLLLADQVGDINLAIAGLLLSFVAYVRWFLQGRQRIGERRARLVQQRRAQLSAAGDLSLLTTISGPRYHSQVLVAGDGLSRYHRSDCLLARGKGWAAADLSVHVADGRVPCGVCQAQAS